MWKGALGSVAAPNNCGNTAELTKNKQKKLTKATTPLAPVSWLREMSNVRPSMRCQLKRMRRRRAVVRWTAHSAASRCGHRWLLPSTLSHLLLSIVLLCFFASLTPHVATYIHRLLVLFFQATAGASNKTAASSAARTTIAVAYLIQSEFHFLLAAAAAAIASGASDADAVWLMFVCFVNSLCCCYYCCVCYCSFWYDLLRLLALLPHVVQHCDFLFCYFICCCCCCV